jgi:hypothetical protein
MKDTAVARWRLAEAEWVLGRKGVSELSDAAGGLLADGMTPSGSLATVASREPSMDPRDIRDAVNGVLDELNLPPLTRGEAARIVIEEVAARIVDGSVPPDVGARDIWVLADHLPPDDQPIDMIALASDWDEDPSAQEEIAQGIRQAASRIAHRRPLTGDGADPHRS